MTDIEKLDIAWLNEKINYHTEKAQESKLNADKVNAIHHYACARAYFEVLNRLNERIKE